METTDAKRTLATILMADVASYGQLMGDDEPQTVRRSMRRQARWK